jgi:hemolysin activation/secretion protein
MGVGKTFGDYDFYQAQILSGRTDLRGFRKTRFYGDSKAFANAEIRAKLLTVRTYLFPASLGILGFHDIGRVWYKDETGIDPSAGGESTTWHRGFGGGIWFTPFNLSVLSLEVAHSNESTLGYVRLGFLF